MDRGIVRNLKSFVSRAKKYLFCSMQQRFTSSKEYWEGRYAGGGTSGSGSYGKFASFKAETLNSFIATHKIESVIEFGCGDGNQLALCDYPSYLGLDVSQSAVKRCISRFISDPTKSFFIYDADCFLDRHHLFQADLVISLDVIYHLIEDRIYDLYFQHLFGATKRYLIIYSTDIEFQLPNQSTHVKHRKFSTMVKRRFPEWELIQIISGQHLYEQSTLPEVIANFYVYKR